MGEVYQNLLAIIGAFILAGGGFGVIVFAIFKWLGERWLTAKFNERLEAFKSAQQRQLEQLKFKINALLDRTVKLHQREFEVLPEAWSRLVDANNSVRSFTSPFQQYADVSRMGGAQLDDFLEKTEFAEWEKEKVRSAADKQNVYQERIFWHTYSACRTSFFDCNTYLLKNGIFIKPEIRQNFKEMTDLLWGAMIEHEHNEQYDPRPLMRNAQKALTERGKQLMETLEAEVQGRLWSEEDRIEN